MAQSRSGTDAARCLLSGEEQTCVDRVAESASEAKRTQLDPSRTRFALWVRNGSLQTRSKGRLLQ